MKYFLRKHVWLLALMFVSAAVGMDCAWGDEPVGELFAPPAGLSFPPLPPEPVAPGQVTLPPLERELAEKGGSSLYVPEGDAVASGFAQSLTHHPTLRLPESWQEPQPFTLGPPYLGTGPIQLFGRWPGVDGYAWEPRFVQSGSYQVFGLGIHQGGRDQVAVGHQLLLDFDLRLTGTERFHVQYRPIGREGSGGSYYQFTRPSGYVDASTAEPSRYWFEGELASMFGGYVSPFARADITVTAGKFPFAAHNFLLINDELLGVMLSQDNLTVGTLSNINLQGFYFFNDVSAPYPEDGGAVGVHASVDHRGAFHELTYVYWGLQAGSAGVHHAAFSRTQMLGAYTLAARVLLKFAPADRFGDGQLYVLEANREIDLGWHPLGWEPHFVFANAYLATPGWRSIAGANFNRLQTAFEVNPLVSIAAGLQPDDRWGLTGGVQCFRDHEDTSLTLEVAVENIRDKVAWGAGMRYQEKLSARTWWELLAIANASDDPTRDRLGAFASWFILW